MKVSLSWLKTFLDTNASVDLLSEKLSSLGLVVDAVSNPAEPLRGFLVAEIMSAERHPDADKLQVCQVSTGSKTLQVVCGAANARQGLKVVLAQSGMTVPAGGFKLRETKIRGVDSFGMLCSAAELGLEESSQGIMEVSPEAPLGAEIADVLQLDDPVLDIDITPNRGDCFAVQGIARDLAASGLGTLKQENFLKDQGVSSEIGSFPCPISVEFDFSSSDATACPHFTGRLIRGVKNGPSPRWLQNRLKSVGLRPISALVDITNYMALGYARPMHVFDAGKLSGNLIVRASKTGEMLWALDDKEYKLDEGMTVIADSEKVVSLAGIMGGEETGCTEETTSVFVESAYFSPESTARTGQALGIVSDSRTRFERGVDPATVLPGLDEATRLILEICGGEASEIVESGNPFCHQHKISLSLTRMQSYTGVSLKQQEAITFLSDLGCQVHIDNNSVLNVTTPSWRHDLKEENDLIEELLRLKGYDEIPQVSLPSVTPEMLFESAPGSKARQNHLWTARRVLASLGHYEVMTWSFIKQEEAILFGGGEASLILDNPISQDMNTMRPTLLPGLLKTAGRNQARGQPDPRLFEVGACYHGVDPKDQETLVAGLRAGKLGSRHWRSSSDDVSLYDIKSDALTVLEACGVDVNKVQIQQEQISSYYHPGRSGRICLGPKNCLAQFGEIHPKILKEMELSSPVVAFEIFMDVLPVPKAGSLKKPVKLSSFQSLERDLAFVLDDSVTAQTVIQAVKKVDRELITSVEIFDDYKGKGVPEGQKSLALTFRLEPHKETLTDADIHKIMDQVIDSVEKVTGGALRS